MAQSPSHKFGQIIGNLIESIIAPLLADFAQERGLYLDHQKYLRSARKGKKVTWEDPYGNVHNLDYVLERKGTDTAMGIPVAFIEVAWRRYAKHSRNKAQEIQGAILPLAEKFQWSSPFLGTVLAGVFTDASLLQLRSLGFQVLYFPYETLVTAFAKEGIDIAFNETTPEEEFGACIQIIEKSSNRKITKIKEHIIAANQTDVEEFMDALNQRLSRMIERIILIPLYGNSNEFLVIEDALEFLEQHEVSEGSGNFRKYEILIDFSNGDHIEGTFREKEKAQEFLKFVAQQ